MAVVRPVPRTLPALLVALLLAACASGPRLRTRLPPEPVRAPAATVPDRPAPSRPPSSSQPTTALQAGLAPVPLPDRIERADAALAAFRLSCPALLKRTDRTGLTRGADWKPACDAAATWTPAAAEAFFRQHFEGVLVGSGQSFATGYYEPEIAGCRAPSSACQVPVYRRPPDLIEVDMGRLFDQLKGRRIRGCVIRGRFGPCPDRGAIEDGAFAGRGLELAYAVDPIELFFLEVQGSGRLRLPDGGVLRLGYDGQNGRDYVGIGRLMRDRGLLNAPGATSMQGIMAWLRAHPAEGKAIMRENRSYVFFRELTGAGPIGAMGVAVTGRSSVAADPAFVPLGAPVLLTMDRREASGLWVAQDTGGAIKGANRFDTFWGAGDAARTTAGGMSARGLAILLLPRGTLQRLAGGATSVRP